MVPSKSDGSPGKTAVAPQHELCLNRKHKEVQAFGSFSCQILVICLPQFSLWSY